MRILYLGNFKYPWCTEVHVARDAERINGVTVYRRQEPSTRPPQGWHTWLADFERATSDVDLVVYQRTWGEIPDGELVALWDRLAARGVQTISYHLDLYIGLKRERGIRHDPFWRTGVVFTADGDPDTTQRLRSLDIDHRWMPAAIVSDEAKLYSQTSPRGAVLDVVFVGSDPDSYHREWPWRRTLIDGLRDRYGARFARLPELGQDAIRGDELNELYCTVPVVVGDSLALPGHVNYWSDRFYETVGRGGFLVGPNVPGLEAHFTSGEHLDLYEIGDLDHVFELVDQALADRPGSRAIAFAGQAHVAANHTYTHRVRAMLESLGLAEFA